MAKISDKKFEKIMDSVEWSEARLQKPREERIKAIREFVGMHYQDAGADRRVVVPFIKLSVGIFLRMLAAKAPRAMVSTKNIARTPVAKDFELALNEIPEEIDLQCTLRRAVLEALFSFAVVKVGLYTTGECYGRNVGDSFVDVVPLDDLVIDMQARVLDQLTYIGNQYWMEYENVKKLDGYDDRVVKPDEYLPISEYGQERAEAVSMPGPAVSYKDKVKVCDLWLPSDMVMITYAVTAKKVLKVRKWKKNQPDPYIIMGFDSVPGNLLPIPPVAVWYDLHILANRLFRKLGSQADGQKNVLGFDGGNDEAVVEFKGAQDGDGIQYTGQPPQLLQTPGPDQMTLNMFMICKDLYSFFGGNLESLGGLAPVADTLGQDKLISQASSAQIRDMADAVVDFSRKIFKALAYYEWNHPTKRRRLEKPIKGTDIVVPVEWSLHERYGSLEDFNFDINVYSMQDDSPSAQLQKLGIIMQNYILPLMPAIEQAGGTLDVQKLLQQVAYLSHSDWLAEIVKFVDKSQQEQAGAGGSAETPAGPPPVRRQERISYNGGPTASGQSKIMQQLMAGGGSSNPQQK